MPGPARNGVLIYAKDLAAMARFYTGLLGLRVLLADAEHQVLESDDGQLILHAIPPHIAASFSIASPPELREEQAIKPWFSVPSLAQAEQAAPALGGRLFGPAYTVQDMTLRNACDPEGNILQLREFSGVAAARSAAV